MFMIHLRSSTINSRPIMIFRLAKKATCETTVQQLCCSESCTFKCGISFYEFCLVSCEVNARISFACRQELCASRGVA